MENISKSTVFDDEKTRWGKFHSIAQYKRDEHRVKVKVLVLDEGKNVSYQQHLNRAEVWNILSGKGTMIVEGIEFSVKQGDVINIPRGAWHTAKASDDSKLEVLEVQHGLETEESDIVRSNYEWSEILKEVEALNNV
jgi:mannose-1-phosphate guanylyltransferase